MTARFFMCSAKDLASAPPLVRLPPAHPQHLKDAPLVAALDQPAAVAPQPALVQPHALLGRQQPHAAVEDVVAHEVDERPAHLRLRHQQEVEPPHQPVQ